MLFDTASDHEGKITNDAELGFRSSWGVTNSSTSKGRFIFNLQEKNLKNSLILRLMQGGPTIFKPEELEILSIRPTAIGIFPFIKVID